MKIVLGGNNTYIRALVTQFTEHVVWLSLEPAKSVMPSTRIPSCVPGLDYVTYAGPGPMDLPGFFRTLKNYNLVCNKSNYPVSFETAELPQQLRDQIKLYRSKCYASQSIQNLVHWALEKNSLQDNPLTDPNLNPDKISEIYQKHLGLSKNDAGKLIEFNSAEQSLNYANIKYSQIEAELAVTNAKTVEEVLESYKNFIISLGNTRVSDQAIMQWL